MGEEFTKWNFTTVLRPAWEKSCNVENAVSGFRQAGLFPFTFTAIKTDKLRPSQVYTIDPPLPALMETSVADEPDVSLPSTSTGTPSTSTATPNTPLTSTPIEVGTHTIINIDGEEYEMVLKPVKKKVPTFESFLEIPTVPKKKKRTTVDMTGEPLILTGDKMNTILKQKEEKNRADEEKRELRKVQQKERAEQRIIDNEVKLEAKEKRDREREEKREKQEREKEEKKEIRERQKKEKKGKGVKKNSAPPKKIQKKPDIWNSDDDTDEEEQVIYDDESEYESEAAVEEDEEVETTETSEECAECWTKFAISPEPSVGCDTCGRWFHISCTVLKVDGLTENEIEALPFICGYC